MSLETVPTHILITQKHNFGEANNSTEVIFGDSLWTYSYSFVAKVNANPC